MHYYNRHLLFSIRVWVR